MIPKGDVPFSTRHIDHFGPIDRKIHAKKHILLVIDGFTKFLKLYTWYFTYIGSQSFQIYLSPIQNYSLVVIFIQRIFFFFFTGYVHRT